MEFITERLILRPWQESDAERLFEYAKDPEVGPIAGWPVHTSVENSLDIIRNVLSVDETYAVCLKDDNKVIGSIGLIPPMQSHTKAAADEIEIGYWLGMPFWGNGYIPEAVKRLQQHAFEDLGCNAMWCGYYDGNEKSKRCQEKCGFIYHHTEENKPCALMGDVRKEHFTRLTKEAWAINEQKKPVVLFVHGKGGSATEADHYRKLFPEHEVVGFDYQAETPWDCINEFQAQADALLLESESIILVAHSIGAFFVMHALSEKQIHRAYFISPIVDMEKLISDMMLWANVTDQDLQEKKIIETSFGEMLSWDYLSWVRAHPIKWNVPTEILYGGQDNLTSRDTIDAFAKNHGANLTIMEDGEHWFHTEEQMTFVDAWIKNRS
ncbi:MAG: GNAT family N-acetyltransferase [Acetobacterium sp.]|uniref:GNAT family N-acetyltransferase n=1 Tax=Acetobacterium sp. TaxID=1872094 RepID=UPI003242766D